MQFSSCSSASWALECGTVGPFGAWLKPGGVSGGPLQGLRRQRFQLARSLAPRGSLSGASSVFFAKRPNLSFFRTSNSDPIRRSLTNFTPQCGKDTFSFSSPGNESQSSHPFDLFGHHDVPRTDSEGVRLAPSSRHTGAHGAGKPSIAPWTRQSLIQPSGFPLRRLVSGLQRMRKHGNIEVLFAASLVPPLGKDGDAQYELLVPPSWSVDQCMQNALTSVVLNPCLPQH